jgi:hypothetical protein
MSFADVIIKLWDKGGVPLLLLVGLFLIAKFIASRFVRALDNVAKVQNDSITKIADAVTASSAAQVVALGGLTERVSRMEGQVVTLGHLAVRAAEPTAESRAVAVAAVVEVFDGEEHTPISVPIPEPQSHPVIPSLPSQKRNTPAKGSPTTYHHGRAPTVGGRKP